MTTRRSGAAIPTGLAVLALACVASRPGLAGAATFRLVVGDVTDSRARTASNETTGGLTLMPRLEGDALGEAKAFRMRVTAARDDSGRSLLPDEPAPAVWDENASGPGLWIRLASPARAAATVAVSGTVDLWAPGRDPLSEVRVPKALARPGKAIEARGLRAAGISLRLAPRERAADGTVVLTGRTSDLAKIRAVKVLRADGTEIGSSGLQTTSEGATGTLEVLLTEPAPPDATLVLGILTKASVLEVPFELKEVPLP